MRWLDPPEPATEDVDVPEELRAGACIEVWTDAKTLGEGFVAAYQAHGDARARFIRSIGLGEQPAYRLLPAGLRVPTSPWSFAEGHAADPEELAERLARRGLPPDWVPSPAPSVESFGPERTWR